MAESRYHCRCTPNSLPGSSSRFTTSSRSTFSQLTAWRPFGKCSCQNISSPSCSHSSQASQAVAERAWPPQFEPAQFDLRTVQRVGGNLPVVREKTHCRVALFGFIEDVQRLAPRRLLLVVNLAQIQNCALCRLPTRQPPVFHHTEVAMILAVLLAVGAAQKHLQQQNARNPVRKKEGRSSPSPFSPCRC